jgi:biopolymer transport protein ExbD
MAGGGNQEENPVAINVVAMVDIIFCLCLFFMCSLKFKPLDAKFDSWLPKNKGGRQSANMNPVIDEIRVIMSWNKEQNRLERLFGQQAISNDPQGDERLKNLIRDSYNDYKARGNPDVAVILDAGGMVPWTHVVNVMDIAKDAGCPKIEFGMGSVVKE